MDSLDFIVTGDGSHTLFNHSLQETYHSRHGAIQESVHVFIQNGLHYAAESKTHLNILEVGFGTGLNALLTLQQAVERNLQINYTTLEAYPLPEAIWSKLNYVDSFDKRWEEYYNKLHHSAWNTPIPITQQFQLIKIEGRLERVSLAGGYDLIYFDAFAPSRQPALWELPVMKKIEQAMAGESVFVTYCARGQLKRDLRTCGLIVETLPGPPGKKEMVRALKKSGGITKF